ncbi:MAG: hypothetical protein JOY81_00325 [Alphaproteobacteria bacterium]|nr:hypothetical protein [Alphaproteobacteria bacterium]
MQRTGLLLPLFVAVLLVSACGPSVSGNDVGGVMPWSGQEPSDAFKAAQAHCQTFGKKARITQVSQPTDKAKGAVLFTCE